MWVPGQNIDGEYQSVVLHNSAPLIAAALPDGSVQIYDEEATRFENLGLRKESVPAKLAWHPSKKYLAVAWNGGVVGLWCLDTESTLREGKIHQCRVTCLEWGPLGNRIVSGDEDGCVVVWKVDQRGRLSTMSQYRLKDQITCCVFRLATVSLVEPRMREKDSPPFFLAGQSGTVYYADDMGHCSEAVSVSAPVHSLFVTESQEALYVVCKDLSLSRYSLSLDGKLTQESSVKLSGGLKSLGINLLTSWIEPDLLAITVNGSPIRIWDAASEDTAILNRQDLGSVAYRAFGYNKRMQIMAVGTDNGLVILWQIVSTQQENERVRTWEPLHKIDLDGGGVIGLSWGISEMILVARKDRGFQLISQQSLCSAAFGSQAVAVQISSEKVVLEKKGGKFSFTIETKERIRAVQTTPEILAIYTGKNLELHKLDDATQPPPPATLISCRTPLFSINGKFLFTSEQNKIDIFNHQALLKHSLLLPREEGDIVRLLSTPTSVVIATREHVVKVFDLNGRDPRLVFARSLRAKASNSEIVYFSTNSTASHVAFTVSNGPAQLYVCNLEQNVIFGHDFQTSVITGLFWDIEDPRILVCELGLANIQGDDGAPKPQVASLFATADSTLIIKDIQPYPEKCEKLIGVAIPHFVYLRKQEMQPDQTRVNLVPGREYIGVENDPPSTIKAITDFCFNLATGDIDDAIKSIKLVRSEGVWENMARICTKLGRTELARLCMGKLKNAKALRTIHAKNDWGKDAVNRQSILTAIQLGLYEDAYTMCTSMQRYDVLSEIYQCTDQWEKSIEICASKDRPALPTVFFKFAEHMKETGDWIGAIAAYEKSGTSKTHVPRMLLSQPRELRNYIDSSSDTSLKLWWARNAESHGDYETALKYYSIANDVLSIVRVYCLSGQMDEAVRLADENPDNAAAAFYIGRQLEEDGKIQQAIQYYARARSFASAIRLAKEHHIDKELMHLALQASPESMSDVARYFESQGILPKSITLYSKAGNVPKALDLCFKIKNLNLLENISATLDPERDAAALQKATVFLVEHGATQNALKLMIIMHRYNEVINLCESQGLQLNEDLIEKMDIDAHCSEGDAKSIHIRIADICFAQGQYQVACKQYTLAGDRLRAMGSLLKSGDKDKIIFFANVSGPRQPEIFVIAANYLQSLNWRTDTAVMKNIIQFYTKAKAYSALARFYTSCALIEIDEFQNYEKALGALKEAEKGFAKIAHPNQGEKQELEATRRKIRLIGLFLEAHEHTKAQRHEESERVCSSLLGEPDIDSDVRVGDIYGLLIESSYNNGQYDKGRQLLAALSRRLVNISVDYYVDRAIVKALGGVPEPETEGGDAIEEDY